MLFETFTIKLFFGGKQVFEDCWCMLHFQIYGISELNSEYLQTGDRVERQLL